MSGVDSPPAFPIPDVRTHDGFGLREGSDGMTLRDWFAGVLSQPSEEAVQTQQSLDRGRNPHNDSYKPALRTRDQIVAELRYQQADAMLAARARGGAA